MSRPFYPPFSEIALTSFQLQLKMVVLTAFNLNIPVVECYVS